MDLEVSYGVIFSFQTCLFIRISSMGSGNTYSETVLEGSTIAGYTALVHLIFFGSEIQFFPNIPVNTQQHHEFVTGMSRMMHKELHHVSQSPCNHVLTVGSSVIRVFIVSEDLEMVPHIIHSVPLCPVWFSPSIRRVLLTLWPNSGPVQPCPTSGCKATLHHPWDIELWLDGSSRMHAIRSG